MIHFYCLISFENLNKIFNFFKLIIILKIYNNLPTDLQRSNNHYILEHPTAKMIKDEFIRLKCDRI